MAEDAELPGLMGNVVFVFNVSRPTTSHSDDENDVDDVCVYSINKSLPKTNDAESLIR